MNRREFTLTTSIGILGSLLFGCKETGLLGAKKNLVIACLGDSVTAGGGNGYVELLQKMANEKLPDTTITFLNWGKSSETVTGLTEIGHPGPRPYLFDRLDELLEHEKVDLVTFCYGINCGIYGKPSSQLFDSYTIGVLSFLEKIKQKGIKAILVSPPPLVLDTVPIEIDTKAEFTWLNPYPNYDEEVIQKFKDILQNIRHDALVMSIDIHTPLSRNQASCYDNDPIHPNTNGHQLIAKTIWSELNL